MSRLASPLLLLPLLVACATEGDSPAKQPAANESSPDQPASKATAPSMPEQNPAHIAPVPQQITGTTVTITSEEAALVGLPKLGFSITLEGSGMSGTKLGPDYYLQLSGPPGGPMILRVSPATVDASFPSVVGAGEVLDARVVEEQLELLGAPRRAAAWITGESLARTSWCAVLLAPAGASGNDPALLLEVGTGYSGDAVACKTALEGAGLEPVIHSLRLE